MEATKNSLSDIFIVILFIVIVATALGIRFVMFLKGENLTLSDVNKAVSPLVSYNKVGRFGKNPAGFTREFSLLNTQSIYATGTVIIRQDTDASATIFLQADLSDVISSAEYAAWFYGQGLEEWKKLGVLEKNMLGYYVLQKELQLKELDYDEVRITLNNKKSGFAPGVVVLKRSLRAN